MILNFFLFIFDEGPCYLILSLARVFFAMPSNMYQSLLNSICCILHNLQKTVVLCFYSPNKLCDSPARHVFQLIVISSTRKIYLILINDCKLNERKWNLCTWFESIVEDMSTWWWQWVSLRSHVKIKTIKNKTAKCLPSIATVHGLNRTLSTIFYKRLCQLDWFWNNISLSVDCDLCCSGNGFQHKEKQMLSKVKLLCVLWKSFE